MRKSSLAVIYMLVSSLAFAAMSLQARELSDLGYDGFQLTAFRGVGTYLIAAGYLRYRGIPPLGNRPRWLLARGLTGAASLALFFLCLPLLPIGAAVALRYLSPLVAILIALVFLRERVWAVRWLYFAMAFGGVVLVNGVDARITPLGLGLVLGSAVFGGITFAIIRKLGTSEHPLVIVAYFTGLGTLLGVGGMLSPFGNYVAPPPGQLLRLISLGVYGFVGQIFMTVAMQANEASRVMPLKYIEVGFVLVLSYFFFDERYGPWALLGLALIILGNVLNAVTGPREPSA